MLNKSMPENVLMAQAPRDMRESFIDSLNQASKINREMFSMVEWKNETPERLVQTERERTVAL